MMGTSGATMKRHTKRRYLNDHFRIGSECFRYFYSLLNFGASIVDGNHMRIDGSIRGL